MLYYQAPVLPLICNNVIILRMTVIDVDTHWESSSIRGAAHPLGPWLDRVPINSAEALAYRLERLLVG